ncbi:Fic family protein [Psychromicrobium xiongbiense]|uniref:Fic family protein n=1 Tax=Psychromicrobium xiongbiense TaxID=3051184 RepID=UPI0025557FE3|nr:Fic family protein [Psychromicrobium sp. YIM S02556]
MSELWRPEAPYNDLPALPPMKSVETTAVLKLTIEARASLAAMNQAAQSMTNPTVLINAIPLLEAQASSEIENIVTTADELFRYAHTEAASATPAAREALRYRTALNEGFRLVKERGSVTTNIAREVCSIIKMHGMDLRTGSGAYIGDPVTRRAVYTPPEGRQIIDQKLVDWELFVNSAQGLDPLVKMALAHYQFEAIHPFADGNGRTGRVLNVLVLVAAGLLSLPVLYLSKYIIAHKNEYYQALRAVTSDESWVEWTEYMLEGVRQTAKSTLLKIDKANRLQAAVKDKVASLPGGGHVGLPDVLFEQPYCRITNVIEQRGVSRPTATKWLKGLEAAGVLSAHSAGRELLFVNDRFMELLVQDEDITQERATPVLF